MGRAWEGWSGQAGIATASSTFLPDSTPTSSTGFPAPPHPSELSQVNPISTLHYANQYDLLIKSSVCTVKQWCIQIQKLFVISLGTFGKLIYLSEPQAFPTEKTGNNRDCCRDGGKIK